MMHKSTMYGQGNGYVVSSWDTAINCYRTSGEMPYFAAREVVAADNCKGGKDCPHAEEHKERGIAWQ